MTDVLRDAFGPVAAAVVAGVVTLLVSGGIASRDRKAIREELELAGSFVDDKIGDDLRRVARLRARRYVTRQLGPDSLRRRKAQERPSGTGPALRYAVKWALIWGVLVYIGVVIYAQIRFDDLSQPSEYSAGFSSRAEVFVAALGLAIPAAVTAAVASTAYRLFPSEDPDREDDA